MKNFNIKNILIPTDFSETGSLAMEHASFLASLFKADLHLLHVVEISESTYSIYDPSLKIRDLDKIDNMIEEKLEELADKIRKQYGITVYTLTANGKVSTELAAIEKEKKIDLIVMGTHGASGFEEYFIGSNAHKTVCLASCPVITVQSHAKKLGFTDIVLPIDNSSHSRQKLDYVIALANKYASRVHILGLVDPSEDTDPKKFSIKIDAVQEALEKAGLTYTRKTVTGRNLAQEAMAYSEKIKADLLVIMTDHESNLTGIFLGGFAKQIVNHSKIPVMSIKPAERQLESFN